MKKIGFIFIDLLVLISVGIFSGCSEITETTTYTNYNDGIIPPKITSMSFAASYSSFSFTQTTTYNYTSSSEINKTFYLVFRLNDEEKDIDTIHISVKDSFGNTVQNGEKTFSVGIMKKENVTVNFSYSLSEIGNFTFSAYAEDYAGNKSEIVEKTIEITEIKTHAPKITYIKFTSSKYSNVNITTVESSYSFYWHIGASDEDKDITKIYLTIKNPSGETIEDKTLTVSNMTSTSWTTNDFRGLVGNGTFTFSAYAEDSKGNKSETLKQTIKVKGYVEPPSKPLKISMNCANTNTDYCNGNYVTAVQIYQGIYVGFTKNTENNDLAKVYLTMKDSSGDIVGSEQILEFSSYYTYCGYCYYTLPKTGTFTISAYAKDSTGNKSNTVEKEIKGVMPADLHWSETTTITANSYKEKSIPLLNKTRTIFANVTCEGSSGVKIYLLDSDNHKLFKNGEPFECYYDFSSEKSTTSFSKRGSIPNSKGIYYFVVVNESIMPQKVAITLYND
ncbi:MAG: hypothetical protein K2M99_09145 [Treponemataceae bacterium]|nr:hypothetical protein [Treponemataceae bacterium]